MLQPVVILGLSCFLLGTVTGEEGEQRSRVLKGVILFRASDDLLQINKLRKRLLKEQMYQRNSRPVLRHSTITNVSLTMFIRKVVALDISTASLTTYSTLHMV